MSNELLKSNVNSPSTSETSKTPQSRYREKNREKLRQVAKEYYEATKHQRTAVPHSSEYIRNYHYTKKYKLSLEEYNTLYTIQKGLCAICDEAETTKDKVGNPANLCVDHCHKTGKVRGLLCRNCNSALGKFQDSLDVLQRAQEYLKNAQVNL